MLRIRFVALALAFLLAAGCTSTEDRAVSGGGIGAAAGDFVGADTGPTVLEGTLMGTGLGAAAGGFTDSDDFNLGEPIWRRSAKISGTTACPPMARCRATSPCRSKNRPQAYRTECRA